MADTCVMKATNSQSVSSAMRTETSTFWILSNVNKIYGFHSLMLKVSLLMLLMRRREAEMSVFLAEHARKAHISFPSWIKSLQSFKITDIGY